MAVLLDRVVGSWSARLTTLASSASGKSGQGNAGASFHTPWGAAMPDVSTLVTALILERPLCMPCIAEKSGLTSERARAALEVVESFLKVYRDLNGRCHACGVSGVVAYSDRPAQSRGRAPKTAATPEREVQRLIEENGALLQLLAAASLEIERLQAKVIELSHTRRTA